VIRFSISATPVRLAVACAPRRYQTTKHQSLVLIRFPRSNPNPLSNSMVMRGDSLWGAVARLL